MEAINIDAVFKSAETVKVIQMMVRNAYSSGYLSAMVKLRKLPKVSLSQAKRIYGVRKVRLWIDSGKLPMPNNGDRKNKKYEYDLLTLERLDEESETAEIINLKRT